MAGLKSVITSPCLSLGFSRISSPTAGSPETAILLVILGTWHCDTAKVLLWDPCSSTQPFLTVTCPPAPALCICVLGHLYSSHSPTLTLEVFSGSSVSCSSHCLQLWQILLVPVQASVSREVVSSPSPSGWCQLSADPHFLYHLILFCLLSQFSCGSYVPTSLLGFLSRLLFSKLQTLPCRSWVAATNLLLHFLSPWPFLTGALNVSNMENYYKLDLTYESHLSLMLFVCDIVSCILLISINSIQTYFLCVRFCFQCPSLKYYIIAGLQNQHWFLQEE